MIYLYIFHENSLMTLEIICLISTLYNIIYLTSVHCFYYVVLIVGYRQYQSHALINYLSIYVIYRTDTTTAIRERNVNSSAQKFYCRVITVKYYFKIIIPCDVKAKLLDPYCLDVYGSQL